MLCKINYLRHISCDEWIELKRTVATEDAKGWEGWGRGTHEQQKHIKNETNDKMMLCELRKRGSFYPCPAS